MIYINKKIIGTKNYYDESFFSLADCINIAINFTSNASQKYKGRKGSVKRKMLESKSCLIATPKELGDKKSIEKDKNFIWIVDAVNGQIVPIRQIGKK